MKKYIIWDWNGTIVDDAGIALDAVNDMLREQHRPEITLEEYRNAMDTPILRFYEQFFDMKATDFNRITDHDCLCLWYFILLKIPHSPLYLSCCQQIVCSKHCLKIICHSKQLRIKLNDPCGGRGQNNLMTSLLAAVFQ